MPVDELGAVTVFCESDRASRGNCWRRALEEACRRGGDVVWGVADSFATARGGLILQGGVGLPPQIAVAHTRLASE
jgi:hypothetical protein